MSQEMPKKSYSFAHLSDLHCPMPMSIPLWRLLNKRITGRRYWLRHRAHLHSVEALQTTFDLIKKARPDHILCSGDLTNLGTRLEQLRMLDWLHKLGSQEDVSLVLGNHDSYVLGDGKRATTLWKDWIKADCQNIDFPFVKEIPFDNDKKIVIFKVNSAIATRPFCAQGRVGNKQRIRLAALLDRYDSQNCFKIIMIHHPPLSGLTSKHRALRDQTKMTQLIKDHAPHLVIYGHNHVHQVSAFQSDLHVTPIIGVGSASEKSGQSKTQGPSFNLYHLSHNTENWVLETRFYTHEESIESQKEFAPQQIWRYS